MNSLLSPILKGDWHHNTYPVYAIALVSGAQPMTQEVA